MDYQNLLHGLQVHVVVQVEVVQVLGHTLEQSEMLSYRYRHYLPVNEEVEHVITLTANLQTCFHPVKTTYYALDKYMIMIRQLLFEVDCCDDGDEARHS